MGFQIDLVDRTTLQFICIFTYTQFKIETILSIITDTFKLQQAEHRIEGHDEGKWAVIESSLIKKLFFGRGLFYLGSAMWQYFLVIETT